MNELGSEVAGICTLPELFAYRVANSPTVEFEDVRLGNRLGSLMQRLSGSVGFGGEIIGRKDQAGRWKKHTVCGLSSSTRS